MNTWEGGDQKIHTEDKPTWEDLWLHGRIYEYLEGPTNTWEDL